MIFSFDEQGRLKGTNYWSCDEGAHSGRCWLGQYNITWQLLAPATLFDHSTFSVAIPCFSRDKGREAGWHWLILPESGAWRLRVPVMHCQGIGVETLPGENAFYRRHIRIYDDERRRTPDGQAWEASFGSTLWVIRPTAGGPIVQLGKMVEAVHDRAQATREERAYKRGVRPRRQR